ncbi:MAG: hypothetical protein Q4G14_11170 [Paracoccus sp. (in: a-proteobacteria)]|uniref:hypothetical protein n=1 Tax=Paracoccus sp. TaxID=267 RepID=UPI0026DFDD4D|nr:hypothetical protein [Paracoccus sp. (in: a-proteobacteria)]MDO5613785.1 hypothetical protein [Paracoccus sp. (in: a-proteobacteria)]
MIVVASAKGGADISLCLGFLTGHGIQAYALDQHMTVQTPHWSQATGGCRIAVPASQAQEAIALLAAAGTPEWQRPGILATLLMVIAFFFAHVPPPDRGTTLLSRRLMTTLSENEPPA